MMPAPSTSPRPLRSPVATVPSAALIALGVSLGAASFTAHAGKPSDLAQLDFFEKKIRPVLAEQCYECHSADAKKVKGGLLLDTREGIEKGGDSGPAIVARNPKKSLLLRTMLHEEEDLEMPPKKDKLPDNVLADFETWIKMGAPDPRDGKAARKLAWDPEQAASHWAFKPIANPPVPTPKDPKQFVKSPIDSFVLAKLTEKGLRPSPPVDKSSLLRRVTYDLTGLPPTAAEVEAFAADQSPNALEKVVDRLLASPQYGERWGRHWLDIARYADTNGDRPNGRRQPLFPHAWTYRDYVIDAFNRDTPYDQFILEQIAADRLPGAEKDPTRLAALGFLTVGKRFLGNENDVIDDRIDTVSKGFMSLTVSCARCHDHKFDPVPTKEYYGFHGIFSSSEESKEAPLMADPDKNPRYKDFLAELKKIEEEAELFAKSEGARRVVGFLDRTGDFLMLAHESSAASDSRKKGDNFRLMARDRGFDAELAAMFLDRTKALAKASDPVFTPWFMFATVPEAEFAAKAPEIMTKLAESKEVNPVIAAAITAKPPTSLKDVAAIYNDVCKELSKQMKLPKYQGGRVIPIGSSSDLAKTKAPLADPGWEGMRQTFFGEKSQVVPDPALLSKVLGVQYTNREGAIRGKVANLELSHPGAPIRAMAMQDKPKARDSAVFIRGEPANRGPLAPRQFLSVLTNYQPKPFTDGSGRLDLAKAIASRENPLTARVLVNRVWQWHFGQAIVRTVSDFGTRSEPPTHPELLDWMATWFMDNGWSLKKLHKLIVLSSTYQQDSRATKVGLDSDPTNQWLWRYNIQRLDFEQVRDTLLVIGGKLDGARGGPPFSLSAPGTQPRKGLYGIETPDLPQNPNRRTVYAMVDRAALPDVFGTFDFANPDLSTGERMLTTVPQQALFMLNSPFVVQQVKNLLARPDFPAAGSDEEKVKFIFRIAFQRAPKPNEMKLALEFLHEESAPEAPATATNVVAAPADSAPKKKTPLPPSASLNVLERYTQVVLLTNELIYVN